MINTRSQASTPTCLHSGGNSEGPSGLRGSHSAAEACSSASHSPAAPSALSRCPFSGARPAKPPACGPSPGTCVPGNQLRMLARPHHPTNHHASLARGPFTARLVARAASPRCPAPTKASRRHALCSAVPKRGRASEQHAEALRKRKLQAASPAPEPSGQCVGVKGWGGGLWFRPLSSPSAPFPCCGGCRPQAGNQFSQC